MKREATSGAAGLWKSGPSAQPTSNKAAQQDPRIAARRPEIAMAFRTTIHTPPQLAM